MTNALTELFADIVLHWGAYLTALVALSGLTMSLIQVAKDLLSLRMWFHHVRVRRWLGTTTALEDDLLRIAAARNDRALYDAELEDVCVQLSAATQMLVDYPGEAPDLLRRIAQAAKAEDLDLIIKANGAQPDNPHARQRLFDARNRVRALTHRAVEIFKLSTAADWRRYLQIAALVLSVLIALLALILSGGLRERPATVIWMALIAGFLAPVARDLLAAVQQLRR
jgi:hypothetical protein